MKQERMADKLPELTELERILETEDTLDFVVSGLDEYSDAMARFSVAPTPDAVLSLQEALAEADFENKIAQALSKVEVVDPHFQNLDLSKDQGFADATALTLAKAEVAKEGLPLKEQKKLTKFQRTLSSRYTKGVVIITLPVIAIACGPILAPEPVPTQTQERPAAAEMVEVLTQTPAPEPSPTAGDKDEMSVAIQDFLNEEYQELGIFGAKKIDNVSTDGGGIFAFADSLFRASEADEAKSLPLLVRLRREDFSVDTVMFLERNEDFSGEALVKYEFLGYTFDPETGTLIDQGPLVQRLKTGEFKIMFNGGWELVGSPLDRHVEPLKNLLTGKELATPTASLGLEIVTPEPIPTLEPMPPLIQPESLAISLDRETLNLLAQINLENLYQPPLTGGFSEIAPYYYGKADELIRIMGVHENQRLRNQYMKFFNENWIVSYDEYRYEDLSYDIRGLGAETIYFKGPDGEGLGHSQAVGFLYGFTGNYVILQIEPGNNLTPEKTPEAFIAVEIRRADRETEGLVGLLTISEYGRSYQRYIQKDGYNVPWFRRWSPIELQESLDLLRGSIVITKGRQGRKLGTYEADMIYFFVSEMPPEGDQISNGYKLLKFIEW